MPVLIWNAKNEMLWSDKQIGRVHSGVRAASSASVYLLVWQGSFSRLVLCIHWTASIRKHWKIWPDTWGLMSQEVCSLTVFFCSKLDESSLLLRNKKYGNTERKHYPKWRGSSLVEGSKLKIGYLLARVELLWQMTSLGKNHKIVKAGGSHLLEGHWAFIMGAVQYVVMCLRNLQLICLVNSCRFSSIPKNAGSMSA